MSDRIPHLDDTVTAANLHERCEKVAVPDFDWLNEPILAIVDGFLHTPPPDATSQAPVAEQP